MYGRLEDDKGKKEEKDRAVNSAFRKRKSVEEVDFI